MTSRHASSVVLGAGAMGSAATYHLARRGEPVTLIEQFTLGHDRGSSHGAGRIARHSYSELSYARLMIEAFQAWRELEADCARPLFLRTGGVSIGPQGGDYTEKVAANLAEIGIPHRRLIGSKLNRTMPAFGVPDNADAVFEPDAGVLSAREAISAEIEAARWLGGDSTDIIERTPVRRIDLESDRPTLVFDDHILTADRLIVTAGTWTGRLLPSLASRLRPTRQQVLYFRPENTERFAIGRFPVFIYKGEEPLDAYYGMPECLGMGVKTARHHGPDVAPEDVDRSVGESYRDEIRGFLRRIVPSLAEAPIDRVEVCLYTMAEGEEFQVGPLPGRPDVIVASPCSGHGFKFSCLIGRLLAELAIEGRSPLALDSWGIS